MDDSAFVSNIQRFCVHDGPGIRTVVFLTGCPLRCKWCQNPETYTAAPQLMYNKALCTRCGLCVEACQQHAISRTDNDGVCTDKGLCDRCFLCTQACPFQARQVSSKPYTIPQLVKEILKDAVFFKNSRGGVTLSGGEPMLHPGFCVDLLTRLKQRGIHTAIETCGFAPWESFERILPVVDLFLYDIKLIDPEKHVRWTGQDNQLIRANLAALVGGGKPITVRVPLIPGVNDDEEFEEIVSFMAHFASLRDLHILPFHQLGSSKYELLGKAYDLADIQENNAERIEACKRYGESKGLRVSVGGSGFKNHEEALR